VSKEHNFDEADGNEGSEDAELDNLEELDGDDDTDGYISDGDEVEEAVAEAAEEEGVESDGCSGMEEKKPLKRKCVEVSMNLRFHGSECVLSSLWKFDWLF
jgi:hypothetical protein